MVVEAETATTGTELEGEVVVAGNAWLHARPDSPIRFRLAAVDVDLPEKQGIRFAVLGQSGGWVELEAGRASEAWLVDVCMDADTELWDLGLRVFVRREDLIPVSAAQTNLSFEDGTSLSLRPGTPIGPARPGDGWRRIDTADGSLHVPVPEEAIGLSFTTWGGPRDERGAGYALDDQPTLSVAGEAVDIPDPHELLVGEAVVRGDEALIELDTRCFHLVAQVSAAAVLPVGGGGTALGTLSGSEAPAYAVDAGTKVYWVDGSEAGQLRADYRSERAPVSRSELRCFTQQVGHTGAEDQLRVELCFDADAVRSPE